MISEKVDEKRRRSNSIPSEKMLYGKDKTPGVILIILNINSKPASCDISRQDGS